MAGYIKLYRDLFNNPVVCKDADHLAIWIYLLCEATHKPISKIFNGKKITIEPGQLITGRRIISQRLSISESKTQRVLILFESDHQIERLRGAKSSLISIVNWSKYQECEQQNAQQMNSKRTASEQQVNTLQEVKEVKNVRSINTIYNDLPQELASALKDFVDHRAKLRKPMTVRAVELLLQKVNKLSNGSTERSVYLLNYAIERGWLSVFEPNESKNDNKQSLIDLIESGAFDE